MKFGYFKIEELAGIAHARRTKKTNLPNFLIYSNPICLQHIAFPPSKTSHTL